MLEYIYFVKCPDCEDEHFYFFNEAKDFALSCMSKKPIITQVEVDRNDFGECVDSCDLGTVWSWEEAMGESEEEPTQSVFTKADLKQCDCGGKCGDNCKCGHHHEDTEFTALDNSLDEAYYAVIEVDGKEQRFSFNTRDEAKEYVNYVRAGKDPAFKGKKLGSMYTESCGKPIPEGMTIEDLVEAMEANEDMIECAACEELFPKDECFYDEERGWLCGDCEDRVVKCTWCDELYDRSDCRREVDLGWLCDHCQAAIKSRGEPLTFRENDYWDFLDEKVSNDTTWVCFFNGGEVGQVEAATEEEALEAMQREFPEFNYNLYDGCFFVEPMSALMESFKASEKVEFIYDALQVTMQGPKRDVDDWDEAEDYVRYSFYKTAEDVATDIWENFIEEADANDVEGGLEALEDDTAWNNFLVGHFDDMLDKYYDKLLKYYEDDARKEYEENHTLGELDEDCAKQKSFLEEFDDAETRKANLTDCPECGAASYDMKEQYCSNCGLGL